MGCLCCLRARLLCLLLLCMRLTRQVKREGRWLLLSVGEDEEFIEAIMGPRVGHVLTQRHNVVGAEGESPEASLI